MLSNWWAGCEPTCRTLARLLNDGYFFADPWNYAIGHLTRKNVPTLVFVFSNEFDNEYNRVVEGTKDWLGNLNSWKEVDHEIVGIPIPNKTNIHMYVDANSPLNKTRQSPDPYCIQLFRDNDIIVNLTKFAKSLGLQEQYIPDSSISRLVSDIKSPDEEVLAISTNKWNTHLTAPVKTELKSGMGVDV